MDLRRVLTQLHEHLRDAGVRHALIGGLALALHMTPRATQDVDLLVDGTAADTLHGILESMGYEVLYRSPDVANYASGESQLGRVNALFARRPYAEAMLDRARPAPDAEELPIPVVDASDLIGLKVQASSNDPARRRRDMADIEQLLREAADLDLDRIRTYFALFEREAELDEILAEIDA